MFAVCHIKRCAEHRVAVTVPTFAHPFHFLSLSALSGLRNHTRNDSSATLSALFLTRSPAAPALLYQPQTNSATVIL